MNDKKLIDEVKIPDYEDGSELNVIVNFCSELGNSFQPGLQIIYMGNYAVFEPLVAQKWKYELKKNNSDFLFLEHFSWTPNDNQFVKIFFVNSQPLKARIEAKTNSSDVIIKEYDLPFDI